MARPKSGEAMVTICTRVPESVRDQLTRRAKAAEKPAAELHRDIVVAAIALDGSISDVLRVDPREVGLDEKTANVSRAKRGVAPVHTPQRTPVARHPEQSNLKGKTFRGPIPKPGAK